MQKYGYTLRKKITANTDTEKMGQKRGARQKGKTFHSQHNDIMLACYFSSRGYSNMELLQLKGVK